MDPCEATCRKMTNTERRVWNPTGWTSTVYAGGDIDSDKVVKVVHKQDNTNALFDNERRAYERLWQDGPGHINVIQYFGVDTVSSQGLTLERAEKHSVREYLWRNSEQGKPDAALYRKWARQAAEALAYVHDQGIIYCDVHETNFFLDKDLNIKLGDFGAVSIDGKKPLLMYRTTHQHWIKDGKGGWRKDWSVASDIFALGCVLYNVESPRDLFEDLRDGEDRDEILRRIRTGEMGDTSDVPVLRDIIQKCWSLEYQSMHDIVADIEFENTPPIPG